MKQRLVIAIPMAGFGTRMRPHTWSKPKPLIPLAGKTVLDYVLGQFDSLPEKYDVEFVFIVGQNGAQIETYMTEKYPAATVHFVVQEEMRGQSHALYQAKEYLRGPMMMSFSDTLIETDLSFLKEETSDSIAWVKPVPDPRRFGVAEVNAQGRVTRLVEKPADISNNLVVVGFYYFRQAEVLLSAIEEQFRKDIMLKNEFFLADAVNIMIAEGANMHTAVVDTWLDAGTPEALFETNRHLLDHGHDNSAVAASREGVLVIPPVYLPESAIVESAVIGPYVSVGEGCRLENCVIQETILGESTQVKDVTLRRSLVGSNARILGRSLEMNIGDTSQVEL